jgi:hypothetical protein
MAAWDLATAIFNQMIVPSAWSLTLMRTMEIKMAEQPGILGATKMEVVTKMGVMQTSTLQVIASTTCVPSLQRMAV